MSPLKVAVQRGVSPTVRIKKSNMAFVCAGAVHCTSFDRCSTRYSNPVQPDVWNSVPPSVHSWFSSICILLSRDQKFQGLYRPACICPARELWKEKGLCFWFDSRFICNPFFNRFCLTPSNVKYVRNGLTKQTKIASLKTLFKPRFKAGTSAIQ